MGIRPAVGANCSPTLTITPITVGKNVDASILSVLSLLGVQGPQLAVGLFVFVFM